jgi:hypothetical protein
MGAVRTAVSIGPGIIVPLVVLIVVMPLGLLAFRRWLASTGDRGAVREVSASRLTSDALRRTLPAGWRLVPEIAPSALGGIDHVLVGPPGVYAITTTMSPVPPPIDGPAPAAAVAAAAIARTGLDDVLRRGGAPASTAHVEVHWGPAGEQPAWHDRGHGAVAVDGRRLDEWVASLDAGGPSALAAAQVDLAWRAVTTGIGRPDPLGG